ncbi:MAG: hypothetical protein BWK79_17465, partial [Beggiatoa sp. IS2]
MVMSYKKQSNLILRSAIISVLGTIVSTSVQAAGHVLIEEDFSEGGSWNTGNPLTTATAKWQTTDSGWEPYDFGGAGARGMSSTYNHDGNAGTAEVNITGGLELNAATANVNVTAEATLPVNFDPTVTGKLVFFAGLRTSAVPSPTLKVENVTDGTTLLVPTTLTLAANTWQYQTFTVPFTAADAAGDLIKVTWTSGGAGGADGLQITKVQFTVATTYGPGGVNSGLDLWFKGDAGTSTTTDGAAVTGWTEVSGNPDIISSTAVPYNAGLGGITYKANAANFNPGVWFSGANDVQLWGVAATTTFNPGATSGATMFTVVNAEKAGSGGVGGVLNTLPYGTGLAGAGLLLQSSGAYVVDCAGTIGKATVATGGLNAYHTVTLQYVSGDIAGSSIHLENGVDGTGGATSGCPLSPSDEFRLAGRTQDTSSTIPGRVVGGTVMEAIYYDGQLSATNVQKVESYLAIKYGITKANNYLASDGTTIWDATANATYHHDVAGIGRDDKSVLSQVKSKSINANSIVTMDNGGAFTADKSFLVWGDNAGTKTLDQTNTAAKAMYMARTWKVTETGTVGNVTVTTTGAAGETHLLVDSDGDCNLATGTPTMTALPASVDFTSGQCFTVGQITPDLALNIGSGITAHASGATAIDSTITLSGTTLIDGATVSIGTGFVSSDALIYPANLYGVTGNYDATTGILTLSGSATPAQYQEILRSVQYSGTLALNESREIFFSLGKLYPAKLCGNTVYHYYGFIDKGVQIAWNTAKSDAEGQSYYGMQGYLTTILCQDENDFSFQKFNTSGWIGASDDGAYGSAMETWVWATGPEVGQGVYTNYDNFAAGEPNGSGVGGEHYGQFMTSGEWNDLPLAGVSGAPYITFGYFIEYGGMDSDAAVQITGVRTISNVPTYAITISTVANGTVTGGGSYPAGSTITLSATPNAGYKFAGWSPAPCANSFTMPANELTCTATFEAIPTGGGGSTYVPPPVETKVIASFGGSGQGKVTSNPEGIDCQSPYGCSYSFKTFTTIQLTPQAVGQSRFQNWGDSCENGLISPSGKTVYCMVYFVDTTPPPSPEPVVETSPCPVANILYVHEQATGDNHGKDWPNAFKDLQDALKLVA